MPSGGMASGRVGRCANKVFLKFFAGAVKAMAVGSVHGAFVPVAFAGAGLERLFRRFHRAFAVFVRALLGQNHTWTEQ